MLLKIDYNMNDSIIYLGLQIISLFKKRNKFFTLDLKILLKY